MAASNECYSVPDLHCFEDLPDFEDASVCGLYGNPTSTKDSIVADQSSVKNLGSNPHCRVCSSSLCQDGGGGTSSNPGDPGWSQWDPADQVSYHDIWCDDNSSWKFTSSGDDESDSERCLASSSDSSPLDSSVPQVYADVAESNVAEDLESYPEGPLDASDSQNVPIGSAHVAESGTARDPEGYSEGPSDVTGVQNVPFGSADEHMSDEDIFVMYPTSSFRSAQGPSSFADVPDSDISWWELSQINSQTSQSSDFSTDQENNQLVPVLQTDMSHHRAPYRDQTDESMAQDGASDQEGQADGLNFNPSCTASEQVVPSWLKEE